MRLSRSRSFYRLVAREGRLPLHRRLGRRDGLRAGEQGRLSHPARPSFPGDSLLGDHTGRGTPTIQVLGQRSPYTGWRTLGVFSLAETLREVLLIRYWTYVIGGITMLLAIVAAYFFTSSIAKPVLDLRSLMKRVEHGDLSVRFSGAPERRDRGAGPRLQRDDRAHPEPDRPSLRGAAIQARRRAADTSGADQAPFPLQHARHDPVDGAGASRRRRRQHGGRAYRASSGSG